MTKHISRLVPITFILLLLAGCANMKEQVVTTVNVPMPIPCIIVAPKKPFMPFTDQDIGKDLYGNVKNMLAEIELRKGYETELEAGITACNTIKLPDVSTKSSPGK